MEKMAVLLHNRLAMVFAHLAPTIKKVAMMVRIVANLTNMAIVNVNMIMTIQSTAMTEITVAKETLKPLVMAIGKIKTTTQEADSMVEIAAYQPSANTNLNEQALLCCNAHPKVQRAAGWPKPGQAASCDKIDKS